MMMKNPWKMQIHSPQCKQTSLPVDKSVIGDSIKTLKNSFLDFSASAGVIPEVSPCQTQVRLNHYD